MVAMFAYLVVMLILSNCVHDQLFDPVFCSVYESITMHLSEHIAPSKTEKGKH
jgi:hypothetical protein